MNHSGLLTTTALQRTFQAIALCSRRREPMNRLPRERAVCRHGSFERVHALEKFSFTIGKVVDDQIPNIERTRSVVHSLTAGGTYQPRQGSPCRYQEWCDAELSFDGAAPLSGRFSNAVETVTWIQPQHCADPNDATIVLINRHHFVDDSTED